MADDEQFDIDVDSEMEDDEDDDDDDEDEGSDDDTGFFPIDEPVVHSSQSNTTTASSSSSVAIPIAKQGRGTSEQSVNKYLSGTSASVAYPQDNNFEYVGIVKIVHEEYINMFF